MKYLIQIIFIGLLLPCFVFAQPENENNLANEYFNDGEYERALELYQRLQRSNSSVDFYVYRVVECYLQLNRANEATDYVNKVLKKQPNAYQYVALNGRILDRSGKPQQAEQTWTDLIQKLKTMNEFATVGSFFMIYQNYPYARKTYVQARQVLKNQQLFAGDLANIYTVENDVEPAITEYFNMYQQAPAQLNYVRSQINRMIKDDNTASVERALLTAVQKYSEDMEIKEILYDFYLQINNFDEALVQAKSLDKLRKEYGGRIYKLAQTLQNNKEYELSNQALDYILKNYKDSPHYLDAYFEKAKNFELKAAETRPVDTLSLRQAVRNYDELFTQFGRKEQFSEAMYRKARLCVFYLNDLNAAISELNQIEKLSLPAIKKAESRLLMGDVFVMQGEYAKAKLKYAEVEDQFKEAQIGAQAKFRGAQLAYFKGDFELAKSYLKILKENTSNDISNDAIRLFLTIQDNTGLDSTTTALQRFAEAELLIYRKNYDKALELLDSIMYAFPNHALTDDIFIEKANIFLNKNEIDKAIFFFDKIITGHKDGIHADDAVFSKAEIYELVLKDKEKAQEYYLKILTDFPASLYKVEARKRIRRLRGDTPASP